jgi:putative ABC transport system ATP-binding protein
MVVIYEDISTIEEGKWIAMVKLEQVSKIYKLGGVTVAALNNVTVEIPAGDFCAFIGPSGCGKSTLLNLVAGLDHPTSGTIILNGRSTGRFTRDEWTHARREWLGLVFQAFHLLPGLTAAENVAFPLLLRGEHGRTVGKRVDEVLELVGMTDRRNHRPNELSGGEQQRVAVARAMVHHPSVILADEPTGNLDSQHGREIVALLRTLVTRFQRTVLLVTHSSAAAEAADYIWMMRDGHLLMKTSQRAMTVEA